MQRFNKAIAATMIVLTILFSALDTFGLNINDRPSVVNEKIEEVFNSLAPESTWTGSNGKARYYLGGIDDEMFVLNIITQLPEQKEFYFVDIGAGEFQWCLSVQKFLMTDPRVPKDKTYHIIGLNGEGDQKPEIIQKGNCIVYKFGHFKIEEIIQAFEERGMHLENKIDLMVSQYTLRHLVDPLGTFLQMHQLMRLGGYMLLEGVPFLRVNTNGDYIYGNGMSDQNLNMEHLLRDLGQPYLMCPTNFVDLRALRDIVIKKTSAIDYGKIDLSYCQDRPIVDEKRAGNGCRYRAIFVSQDVTKLEANKEFYRDTLYVRYYNGDKALYEFLNSYGLFVKVIEENGMKYDRQRFQRFLNLKDLDIEQEL